MKLSGRIAADTNVVLSAAAGRAAGRIFRSARGLETITTETNYAEIEEYLPRLAEWYGLEMSDIAANLVALPRQIKPADALAATWPKPLTLSDSKGRDGIPKW